MAYGAVPTTACGKAGTSSAGHDPARSAWPGKAGVLCVILLWVSTAVGGGMVMADAIAGLDWQVRFSVMAALWLAFFFISLALLVGLVCQHRRARRGAQTAQRAEHRLGSYALIVDAIARGEAVSAVFADVQQRLTLDLGGGELSYIDLADVPDPAYLPGFAWLGKLLQHEAICKKLATGRLLSHHDAIALAAMDQPEAVPCYLQPVLGRQGQLFAVLVWRSAAPQLPEQDSLLQTVAQLFGMALDLARCLLEVGKARHAATASAVKAPAQEPSLEDSSASPGGGVARGREGSRKPIDALGFMSADAAQDYDLAELRLLLVEDNRINQQIAKELLKKAGVRQIEVANNGREAVEKLTAVAPTFYQAVLMDLQMPEMDGMAATRIIRADSRFDGLPIIAMTAHAMAEVREQCLAVGMNDHIVKPINPELLYQALVTWAKPGAVGPGAPSAASAPQNRTEPLPDLPGVKVADGLRRMGGSLAVYQDILQKFRINQQHVIRDVRSALAGNDVESAIRQLHTLKGILGSLGAEALQDKAKDIETRLADGQYRQVETWLVRLEGELATLFAGIDKVLPAPVAAIPDEEDGAAPSLSPAALLSLIQTAKTQMEEFDVAGETTLAQIRRLMQGRAEVLPALDEIERCLKHYDYEQGLTRFMAWADGLDIK